MEALPSDKLSKGRASMDDDHSMTPILISNPVPVSNEAAIINGLFDEGLELLHLRKPDYTEEEYRSLIQQINSKYLDRLVLHQFHELAQASGINRLHFPETKRKETTNWEACSSLTLSTSVHSIEAFNQLPKQFDYAFLSPVFPSISKEGYRSDLDLLKEVHKRTNFNTQLVALGGITQKNIQQVMEKGFDAIALLGTIWNSHHPIKNYNECRISYNTYHKETHL